jgi:hypothetical protein
MSYALRADVSTAETDGGVTLLDERSGEYFNLNPSGALVLHALLADASRDEVVDRLVAEYDIDRATADRDVTALVSALRSADLLVTP